MAQAQLMFSEESLSYLKTCGFETVNWCPITKEVRCSLDDKHLLTIKKKRSKTVIILQKGKSTLSIDMKQFESLCDLKESIQLLGSFLQGQS
jgi:hypothetical protein